MLCVALLSLLRRVCRPFCKDRVVSSTGETGGQEISAEELLAATSMSAQASLLREEVRVAIKSLQWPPLVSRDWESVVTAAGDATTVGGKTNADAGVDPDKGGTKLEDGGGDGQASGFKSLKVMSWNVLCDGLSGSHPDYGGFSIAPKGCLDWEKRR